MKHYMYSVLNNKIDEFDGEVSGTSADYKQYEKSFGVEEIYYKMSSGKIINVICEAFTEKSAKKAVEEFLSNL